MKAILAILGLLSLAPAHAEFAPWSDRELRILQSFNLSKLGGAPPQPSNAYADNEDAAAFGKKLPSSAVHISDGSIGTAAAIPFGRRR